MPPIHRVDRCAGGYDPHQRVCAGEHIDNTSQVVRDAEARPIPGPGTAQYQPRLYQNLDPEPDEAFGKPVGLHDEREVRMVWSTGWPGRW